MALMGYPSLPLSDRKRIQFAKGIRRSVVLTACTVLDRADGAIDVRESASRSLGELFMYRILNQAVCR
jgi:hypothetical protein